MAAMLSSSNPPKTPPKENAVSGRFINPHSPEGCPLESEGRANSISQAATITRSRKRVQRQRPRGHEAGKSTAAPSTALEPPRTDALNRCGFSRLASEYVVRGATTPRLRRRPDRGTARARSGLQRRSARATRGFRRDHAGDRTEPDPQLTATRPGWPSSRISWRAPALRRRSRH